MWPLYDPLQIVRLLALMFYHWRWHVDWFYVESAILQRFCLVPLFILFSVGVTTMVLSSSQNIWADSFSDIEKTIMNSLIFLQTSKARTMSLVNSLWCVERGGLSYLWRTFRLMDCGDHQTSVLGQDPTESCLPLRTFFHAQCSILNGRAGPSSSVVLWLVIWEL